MYYDYDVKILGSIIPLMTGQILAGLDKLHRQIEAGQGIPADVVMEEVRKKHGFI